MELTVTDLDRAVAFYQDVIGLRPHRLEPPVAALGVGGEDVLVLVENPGARPAGRHAGLYHVAILSPRALELARAALRDRHDAHADPGRLGSRDARGDLPR